MRSIDGHWYFHAIQNDLWLFVEGPWYRSNDETTALMFRCRDCYRKHQKIFDVITADTSESDTDEAILEPPEKRSRRLALRNAMEMR